MKVYIYDMSIKSKRVLVFVLAMSILIILSVIIANMVFKNKIKHFIDELPEHISLKYDDIDLNIVTGDLTLESPEFTLKGKTTNDTIVHSTLSSVAIEDFSLYNLLFKDSIVIERLTFNLPKIKYHHNPLIKNAHYKRPADQHIKMPFIISNVNISNGVIDVVQVPDNLSVFQSLNINMNLTNVAPNIGHTSLPFHFDTVSLNVKEIEYQLNDFERMSISHWIVDSEKSVLKDVKLKTQYSKDELSKHLEVERDHYDLSISSITLDRPKFLSQPEKRLEFISEHITFKNPHFEIYRDKLVKDDLTEKKLYSEALRDLNFDLTIDHVSIEDATIIYQEKVKTNKKAGELRFTYLTADMKNIGNTFSASNNTDMHINATFMDQSPLVVDWSFDVNNVHNQFLFKAEIGQLQAAKLNQFMKPNLNIMLEGELLKTFFTIDGNSNRSHIDLKTRYDNFDVVILKDNGKEKNKFLSGLVNIFIAKNSATEKDEFRHSDTKEVERDKTKSVFNFIWKNAQSGLLSAMTGNGKKNR